MSIYEDWDRFMREPTVLPTLKKAAEKPTRGRQRKLVPPTPRVFSDDGDEAHDEAKLADSDTSSGASQPRTMLKKRKARKTATPDITAPEMKRTKRQQASPKSR